MHRLLCVLAGALVLGGCSTAATPQTATRAAGPAVVAAAHPTVRHVFVINLENKGYAATFGSGSKAPYLAKTLAGKGQLLTEYHGIAHHSLPNYIAQISGQGPDAATQGDCPVFSRFHRTRTVAPQQAVGHGCVYPASVRTLAGQLRAKGFTWRGYMEDMGRGCRHPRLGHRDTTQRAQRGDQYALRHNPFLYFRSVIDHPGKCRARDVALSHLGTDLKRVSTTRNLSYITPNLCNDGHDNPCVTGRTGGLVAANAWLKRWVPRILASPAFRRNGLLVVTFDEADTGDATACCGESSSPNAPHPGLTGPGGGRVGAVLISPFITPATRNATPYNHYSLLRSVEDLFGLGHLGYAATTAGFGADVWD
ncbi:MAG: alkaline phosphatase family protein [Nocardioidaceae bacterium]